MKQSVDGRGFDRVSHEKVSVRKGLRKIRKRKNQGKRRKSQWVALKCDRRRGEGGQRKSDISL